MEFWGAEVKSGESLKVCPGDDKILHLSQANIGERKKEKVNETVRLFLNVDGTKLVLGTLFTDKLPQQQFDLVFDKDFEISHNQKSGSVYFYGYKTNNPFKEESSSGDEFDDSESEEDIPLNLPNHAKHESKAKEHKSAEAAKEKKYEGGKQKVLTPEIETDSSDEDSSQDDLELDSEDEDDSSEDSDESEEVTPKKDVDDSSDNSDDSEKETPKKVETSKKRRVESATKTPVADKKAKATPQKTDGKKSSVHVDTPYPSKPAGKTANKPNQQTPKSGGSHICKSCNRTFGSGKGLESHLKAKHGGGK